MVEQPSQRRFSRFMAGFSLLLMLASPVALLLIWLNFGYFEPFIRSQMGLPATTTITPDSKFLAAIVTFLRLGIGVLGLFFLRRTFLEGAAGRSFSAISVNSFSHFAWAALAYVIAAPIERTLTILVLTMGNREGERMVSISVGTPDIYAVFVGLLFVAVAHMFRQGQKLAQENESFL